MIKVNRGSVEIVGIEPEVRAEISVLVRTLYEEGILTIDKIKEDKDERSKETERMEKAMTAAYRIADNHPTYKNLDALVVVGDFANRGQQCQMDLFKETLQNFTREETKKIIGEKGKGRPSPNKGKSMSEEQKRKISFTKRNKQCLSHQIEKSA